MRAASLLGVFTFGVGISAQIGYTAPLAQVCNSSLPRVLW